MIETASEERKKKLEDIRNGNIRKTMKLNSPDFISIEDILK